jgi:hypothetical protein
MANVDRPIEGTGGFFCARSLLATVRANSKHASPLANKHFRAVSGFTVIATDADSP